MEHRPEHLAGGIVSCPTPAATIAISDEGDGQAADEHGGTRGSAPWEVDEASARLEATRRRAVGGARAATTGALTPWSGSGA